MSKMKPDYSVVVPVFNSCESLEELFLRIGQTMEKIEKSFEVVFVDDGSSDGTLQALHNTFDALDVAQVEIRYEKHAKNRGLGAAIRTGLESSIGDVVLTTDSDGTYKYTEIPALLACLTPTKCSAIWPPSAHPCLTSPCAQRCNWKRWMVKPFWWCMYPKSM